MATPTATSPRAGAEPPDPYVPNATIRVEFGIPMRDPGDPVAEYGAVACLQPPA